MLKTCEAREALMFSDMLKNNSFQYIYYIFIYKYIC